MIPHLPTQKKKMKKMHFFFKKIVLDSHLKNQL